MTVYNNNIIAVYYNAWTGKCLSAENAEQKGRRQEILSQEILCRGGGNLINRVTLSSSLPDVERTVTHYIYCVILLLSSSSLSFADSKSILKYLSIAIPSARHGCHARMCVMGDD